MSFDEEVSRSELSELVHYFSKYPFRARDANSKIEGIQKKCLQLFAKDYKFTSQSFIVENRKRTKVKKQMMQGNFEICL